MPLIIINIVVCTIDILASIQELTYIILWNTYLVSGICGQLACGSSWKKSQYEISRGFLNKQTIGGYSNQG